MSKKKSYDRTFKEQAIQLALTSKQSIAKTAKELGVLESTLYYWVTEAKAKKSPSKGTPEIDAGKMHEALLKLRKENQRLQETCEILKKATAYFASE